MKNTLLLFALLISLYSSAQISIQNSDLPHGGDTYLIANGIPLLIPVNSLQTTGANQSWNFNLTAPTQGYDTAYAMDQVPIIYDLVFFGSDYADRLAPNISLGNAISVTGIYSFYNLTSSKLEQTGTGASISGLPVPSIYNPKDEVYHLPINYGNVDSCNFAFNDSIPTIGRWLETGHRVNHVDGWGTLETPMGSKNVLRVRSDVYYNDSLFIDALGFGFKIPRHQVEYKWLANGGGFPMLQVVTNITLGLEVVTQVLYQDTLNTLGTNNISAVGHILIYPQPAASQVIISSGNSDVINTVVIYDLLGREVKRITGNNKAIINISTSDIPSGLYPVILQGRNKNYETKISVIH